MAERGSIGDMRGKMGGPMDAVNDLHITQLGPVYLHITQSPVGQAAPGSDALDVSAP